MTGLKKQRNDVPIRRIARGVSGLDQEPAGGGPTMRQLILEVLRAQKVGIKVQEIADLVRDNGFHPSRGRTSLRYRVGVQLSILAKRGEVERIGRGLYRVKKKAGRGDE